MTGKTRKRLVLWDIDRTLIESRGVGRMVYERVFPEVVGKPLREMPLVHGRTELDIMYEALRSHDVEPTEHLFRRLSAALAEGFRAVADELAERGRVPACGMRWPVSRPNRRCTRVLTGTAESPGSNSRLSV